MSSMRTAHPKPRPEPEPRSAPTPAPEPAPAAPAQRAARRTDLVKFTATLEPETVERFERVTAAMRPVGRLAAGRYPSRADVLRAVLALVEEDQALMDRVVEQVRTDLTRPADGQTA